MVEIFQLFLDVFLGVEIRAGILGVFNGQDFVLITSSQDYTQSHSVARIGVEFISFLIAFFCFLFSLADLLLKFDPVLFSLKLTEDLFIEATLAPIIIL